MTWHVIDDFEGYERAREAFVWNLPTSFNPAVDFLRKHDPGGVALIYDTGTGSRTYSRRALDTASGRLASGLADRGVEAGDRVAVVAGQRPETLTAHFAAWKLGAITVPLSTLFGPDALEYRLQDSQSKVAVIDPARRQAIEDIECPSLETVLVLADDAGGEPPETTGVAEPFDQLVATHDGNVDIHDSSPETPSTLLYTSGSTGQPKGVLHSHAVWLGRAAAAHTYFEQPTDATMWTPADWAWGGALGGTVCAAFHFGHPVVATPREGFDPEWAFEILSRHRVTHTFFPPTALRMLEGATPPADLALEVIAAAGEPLTRDIWDWREETLPEVSLNEFYGQTELNLVVGNCSTWFDAKPASMGKVLPGYDLTILDTETYEPVEPGEVGEIALDPLDEAVFFTEYWERPAATADKRHEEWYLTGDLGTIDEEGYVSFVARDDDLIITRGYRVGPTEVESVILSHPVVAQVGVIGVPDETTGEAIAAFVEPSREIDNPEAVCEDIRDLVRERLAEYQYPTHIEFRESLPQTETGKIQRASLRDSWDG